MATSRSSSAPLTESEQLLLRFADRARGGHRLAHQFLFAHRHPDETPPFHYEIIDDLWSPAFRLIEIAFRGAAKSTIAEEYITLACAFRLFRNFIIVGESFTRASERLAAIKHEIDFNDNFIYLFGNLHGPVWNEDKIVLANGVVVQAFGRFQSLRGTKHDDARPDGCLIDDLEDEESVATPAGRDKAELWILRTLLPALTPDARVRMLANLLDPDCLAVRLEKTGHWTVRRYPWEHIDRETGERTATWPGRFSLRHIDRIRSEYAAAGRLNEYSQEYMVEAIDPSTRVFTRDMFKIVPRVRTWEPVYAMYDPARTVKVSSSMTGVVVFSWIGSKLIVWEAEGHFWLPDKIIEDILRVAREYQPVVIGVEKVGLEEFLMQPLRSVTTHALVPVKAMPAPVGKISFIRSLQPHFISGEVEFAKPFPTLEEQLLSHPTGRNDVPNALAYAMHLRPGLPVYENFGFKNVQSDMELLRQSPCYLAINAVRQYTTAVLLQRRKGIVYVVRDWLYEGDPGAVLGDIAADARLAALGEELSVFAPPSHFRGIDAVGLVVATRKNRIRVAQGGEPVSGRAELRSCIDRTVGSSSALLVSTRARWTVNAMAGGYSRAVVKPGAIKDLVDDGPYKVLIEGLESLAAVTLALGEDDAPRNFAYDPQGRKYLSARATHHGSGGGKAEV